MTCSPLNSHTNHFSDVCPAKQVPGRSPHQSRVSLSKSLEKAQCQKAQPDGTAVTRMLTWLWASWGGGGWIRIRTLCMYLFLSFHLRESTFLHLKKEGLKFCLSRWCTIYLTG